MRVRLARPAFALLVALLLVAGSVPPCLGAPHESPAPLPVVSEVDDGSKQVKEVPWSEHDQVQSADKQVEAKDFAAGQEAKGATAKARYLAELKKWVGYLEVPDNRTVFGRNYITKEHPKGWDGVAWCSIFLSVAARWAGISERIIPQSSYVPSDRAYFKRLGRYDAVPHVGDWVIYGANPPNHIEAVVAEDAKTITTIGGNTTNGRGSKQGVWEKRLSRTNPRIDGYGHIEYTGAGNGKTSGPAPGTNTGGSLPRTGPGDTAWHVFDIGAFLLAGGACLVAVSLLIRQAYRGRHRRRAGK